MKTRKKEPNDTKLHMFFFCFERLLTLLTRVNQFHIKRSAITESYYNPYGSINKIVPRKSTILSKRELLTEVYIS